MYALLEFSFLNFVIRKLVLIFIGHKSNFVYLINKYSFFSKRTCFSRYFEWLGFDNEGYLEIDNVDYFIENLFSLRDLLSY